MKGGFNRLIGAAMIAFACVGMWGCSETTFEWDEKRSGAKVMGFVDDSLVMVEDYRCWSKYTNYANGSSDDDRGCENARLCVYNYRVQEDGPRWCDSLTGSYTNGMWDGQFSDSVIWGHLYVQRKNSISLWKIGEKPHTINLNRNLEGCSIVFRGNSVKEWIDGTFIVRNEKSLNAGGDSCQYAVLDTSLKTITYKRLEKNLEWIENCDDVRAWEKDVYCVILDDEGENSHVLKNENDTIPAPRKFAIGGFWGNMIKMSGNICNINNDKITCSDVIWYGNGEGLKFYQNDEIVVEY
ncbi:MAG: hypothetical protein J6W51_03040 [Fibrobacter sp.]|nr:hypothetical protein [Fibrobacter sp.]